MLRVFPSPGVAAAAPVTARLWVAAAIRVVARVAFGTWLAASLGFAAGACDQNMSDRPLPRASAAEVSLLASRLSQAPSLSAPAGSTISGQIDLAPRVAALTSPTDVIYVIAREPGNDGPPLAVARLQGNAYPMPFVLETPASSEVAGAPDGRPVQVIVRVDKDGDAGTSGESDLVGFTPLPVKPGETGLRITLEGTLGEIAAAVGDGTPAAPVISGTISLPPDLHARTSSADVVFVIARDPARPLPPVAVARLSGNRYPMTFTLDETNRMLGGEWPDTVELEVRVDRDGDPLTRAEGELAGRPAAAVRPGDSGVRVELGG